MGHAFATGLLVPALGLALLGWLVPRMLSLVFAEGVRPLLALGAVSMVIMFALSAFMFVTLYVIQGVSIGDLMRVEGGIGHFVWLSVLSALLWGPILLVSVASLPKMWVKEEW